MIETKLESTTTYYTVTGLGPMCGGRRCGMPIRFLPTEAAINCGYLGGDGQIDAVVTGPVVNRRGQRRVSRPGGLLFDGPVEDWPQWLRDLAVYGQIPPARTAGAERA